MNPTLKKIDSFVVKQSDNLINIVLSLVFLSTGLIMLVDHRGLNDNDVVFFSSLGAIFLIGGVIGFSLNIITVILTQQNKDSERVK